VLGDIVFLFNSKLMAGQVFSMLNMYCSRVSKFLSLQFCRIFLLYHRQLALHGTERKVLHSIL